MNARAFLERFRAVSHFTARKSPSPVLETVLLEVTETGEAWLHARNVDAQASLALPVLKVTRPGRVQLARDQVVKA